MNSKFVTTLIIVSTFIVCASAQILPQGFNQVIVAPGLTQPTTFAIAPDGRFFIVQQNGIVKIVKNGAVLPQPFMSISVCTGGERGLLGVAIDPQFTVNNYVYFYYTIPGCAFNRVSRFTASGDTVVPGSETVLIELDSLIAVNHGGGHLDFGPDGKLYIAVGENERPNKAQDLDSYLGKVLRINPDGTAPVDNPFPAATNRKYVWAYGFRNPFTFEFEPGTGTLWVNDVGDTTWEEINDATVGGLNFGWPMEEGFGPDTSLENPVFVYQHGSADSMGCAITGGTFYNPPNSNYPSIYLNRYYYTDYCGHWINSISLDSSHTWSHFATNIANYSVCIKTGPDGNLYFLSRNNEAMYKITYTPDSVPSIITDPSDQTVSLGFQASFTSTASGLPPLSYQWRKDGIDIAGATNNTYINPAVAFSDSGDYDMIVFNAYGADTSNTARLTVTGNQPPVADIDTPQAGALYSGGDTIYFHGTIVDPEDGPLPDSMFAWEVVFHHETHTHPGPTLDQGVNSGTFSIPTSGEPSADVFFRLYLYAHDAFGALDTDSVDIHPRTTTFIVSTQPQGLMVTVGGQPVQAPDTVLGVEGMIREIGAPYTQLGYLFTHWSDGGTLDHNFVTPVDDSTFTAFYAMPTLTYSLGNDTILCVGDQIVLDAGNYVTYAWNDGTVGQFQTLQSLVVDTMTYGVTVTDSMGAAGNDSITVIWDICDRLAGSMQQPVSIYPNPSSGTVSISPLNENYYLTVTDMTGKILVKKEWIARNEGKTIRLPAGVYSFNLQRMNNEVVAHRKIVILN